MKSWLKYGLIFLAVGFFVLAIFILTNLLTDNCPVFLCYSIGVLITPMAYSALIIHLIVSSEFYSQASYFSIIAGYIFGLGIYFLVGSLIGWAASLARRFI